MSLSLYNFSSTSKKYWTNNPVNNFKSFIYFKEWSSYNFITLYDSDTGLLNSYKYSERSSPGFYPSDFISNPDEFYDIILPDIYDSITSYENILNYENVNIFFEKYSISYIFDIFIDSGMSSFEEFLDLNVDTNDFIDPNYSGVIFTYREWMESFLRMFSDIFSSINNFSYNVNFSLMNVLVNRYDYVKKNKENWILYNNYINTFLESLPYICCNIYIDKYITGGSYDSVSPTYECSYDMYYEYLYDLFNQYVLVNDIIPVVDIFFNYTNLESIFFRNKTIGFNELKCFINALNDSGIDKTGLFVDCNSKELSFVVSEWINSVSSLCIKKISNDIDFDYKNIYYKNIIRNTNILKEESYELYDYDDDSIFLNNKDFRPIKFYDMFDGSYSESNKLGISSWWNSLDSVNVLLSKMKNDYSEGFRRFCFYLPAGTINGGLINPNHWHSLSEEKKQNLKDILSPWIKSKDDIEVILYSGICIDDYSYDFINYYVGENVRIPNIKSNKDLSYLSENFAEWISLGVSSFIFDTHDYDIKSGKSLIDLHKYYYAVGINVRYSPIKILNKSFSKNITQYGVLDSYNVLSKTSLSFNVDNSEIISLLEKNDSFILSDIENLCKKGICIGTFGSWVDSHLFKIYDNFILPLISEDEESSSEELVTFSIENEEASDRNLGFGTDRYSEVKGYAIGDYIPLDKENCEIVCLCNSVDGSFSFNSNLSKYDVLSIDLRNVSLRNAGMPHRVIEDSMESINSGLPSYLSQVCHTNVVNVGIFYEKQYPGLQNALSTPYQAKYISPCSSDWYDTLNSTINNEIEYDSGNMNVSIPYASSVLYVPEISSVLVGGIGGILKISTEDKYISYFYLDNLSILDIKNITRYGDYIFILTDLYLYIYNINDQSIAKDSGYGLPKHLFSFSIMLNNTMIIGAEDGLYVKKINNNSWEKVLSSNSHVSIVISPDASFAIVDNGVWSSMDGLSWKKKGSLSSSIIVNGITRYKSQFYIATNSGLFSDNGSFYNDSINFSLVDVLDDVDESKLLNINDIVSYNNDLIFGLDNGDYYVYNSDFNLYSDSHLDTIHKICFVGDYKWMFGYDMFKCFDETIIRKLSTGGIIESFSGDGIDTSGGSGGSGGGSGGSGGSGGGHGGHGGGLGLGGLGGDL